MFSCEYFYVGNMCYLRMFFHKVKSATTLTIFVSYLVSTVYPCCWPVHFIFAYFSIKIPKNYFNVIS